MTKILLIVASIFLFVVVIVGVIQPSIEGKGNDVKTSIDGTKLKNN
ncbi:hypothetical protein [Heyndrickxia sporothermodurans]|uniref:Uncharacterized protein n=1 Tax=Heyndrickxia sporothermodurans TaxID=46224 RepID=A0AB37H9U5_9BACI|nr:hypothetical protein [Heyndrickxia sporothermodurans]MBL5768429.1 hypothetical protein [Heyndrickxia sporothermodurans]MBL5772091.1 hypothetical protein [Heyndrickxia sporothermodurans]MBL5776183.1 hypothetical protein [Heyndrickxia sporothermodurans]MBL5779332.1 hypothetical protein [Heyndrickxia sporothermodurans]MBL5783737.1 hypothetical protein [Heyndrickxia sporothermodurans]